MKLYTGGGDDGTTQLFGGQRVAKDSPRIAACGAVDELNSHVASMLNRLGDWLFAAARFANRQAGAADVIWMPSKADHHRGTEGTENDPKMPNEKCKMPNTARDRPL